MEHASSVPNLTDVSVVSAKQGEIFHKRKRRDSREEMTQELQIFKTEILGMLNSWKEEQAPIIKNIQKDLSEVKAQNVSIIKKYEDLEKSIKFFSAEYDDLKIKVEKLEKERKGNILLIENLESKFEEVQRHIGCKKIEIRNLPEIPNENLMQITEKLHGEIGCEYGPTTICDVFRVPARGGKIRPIIAEFASSKQRDNFIKCWKKAMGGSKPIASSLSGHNKIYVSEYLTPLAKKLFFHGRELTKQKIFKFCWTNHGRVFLRKEEGSPYICLKSELQLREITETQE